MTPEERANKVRAALADAAYPVTSTTALLPNAIALLPWGSIILTPDELARLRDVLRFARLHDDSLACDEAIALLGGSS